MVFSSEFAEASERNVVSSRFNHDDIDENARIQQLINELDEDDEEEIDALLNDENFESNDDNAWEVDDHLVSLGLEAAVESEAGTNIVFVNGINCATHTMQLVVRDAIALLPKHQSNVITLATKVSKFFRKESTRNAVKNMGLKLKVPSVEMPTRWSSTYMMVRLNVFFKPPPIVGTNAFMALCVFPIA